MDSGLEIHRPTHTAAVPRFEHRPGQVRSSVDKPIPTASYNHKFLDARAKLQETSGPGTFVPTLSGLRITAANLPTTSRIIAASLSWVGPSVLAFLKG